MPLGCWRVGGKDQYLLCRIQGFWLRKIYVFKRQRWCSASFLQLLLIWLYCGMLYENYLYHYLSLLNVVNIFIKHYSYIIVIAVKCYQSVSLLNLIIIKQIIIIIIVINNANILNWIISSITMITITIIIAKSLSYLSRLSLKILLSHEIRSRSHNIVSWYPWKLGLITKSYKSSKIYKCYSIL